MNDNIKVLQSTHISVAVEKAKNIVNLERSGVITGLYSRFPRLNSALLKYFRFSRVYLIAGMSGSGKSAFLNILEDDFTNPRLNPSLSNEIAILAFKYEMEGSDEVLRNVSGKIEKSYSYLISAESYYSIEIEGADYKVINGDAVDDQGNVILKNVILTREPNIKYNAVNDEEFNRISIHLDSLKDKPIYYFETAGDLLQLYRTVEEFNRQYPNKKLVVTLDHKLLSKKLTEKDDMALVQNTAHIAIALRKNFGAMVIILGQLNGAIEDNVRIEQHTLHYPKKTDIYCGGQIYWACDNVMIYHKPEAIGIERYGKKGYHTKDLVHLSIIKGRFNRVGQIFLKDELSIGKLSEFRPIPTRQ